MTDSYLVIKVYVTREKGNFSWSKRYRFDTILLRAIFPYFPTVERSAHQYSDISRSPTEKWMRKSNLKFASGCFASS